MGVSEYQISYDPRNILGDGFNPEEDWSSEDLFQAVYVPESIIVDLGNYNGVYKILVVYEGEWDRPLAEFADSDPIKCIDALCAIISADTNPIQAVRGL